MSMRRKGKNGNEKKDGKDNTSKPPEKQFGKRDYDVTSSKELKVRLQELKERVAKELGKDAADVTMEEIEKTVNQIVGFKLIEHNPITGEAIEMNMPVSYFDYGPDARSEANDTKGNPDLKEEFSKPRNTGKTDEWKSALRGEKPDVKPIQPWKGHLVEYDPRTGKPRYRGQRTDSEVPKGRTVPSEELAERREPDTEIRITRNVSAEQLEKQRREREMIVKPDEIEEKEKSKEPEKRKEKTPRERFEDFMREKPKE